MGERRFWTGRAEPTASARYGAFWVFKEGNFEWLVLREISTVSAETWTLDRSTTQLFEVSTPRVKICYNHTKVSGL